MDWPAHRLQRRGTMVALSLACLLAGACGGGAAPASAIGTATLTWNAPDDPAVVGYRVYYGAASRSYLQARGAGLDAGSPTTYVVDGLPLGSTYYFAVTAVDAMGNESAFSNEASKHFQ